MSAVYIVQNACLELPAIPPQAIDALSAVAKKHVEVKEWFNYLLTYYTALDQTCQLKIPLR